MNEERKIYSMQLNFIIEAKTDLEAIETAFNVSEDLNKNFLNVRVNKVLKLDRTNIKADEININEYLHELLKDKK